MKTAIKAFYTIYLFVMGSLIGTQLLGFYIYKHNMAGCAMGAIQQVILWAILAMCLICLRLITENKK